MVLNRTNGSQQLNLNGVRWFMSEYGDTCQEKRQLRETVQRFRILYLCCQSLSYEHGLPDDTLIDKCQELANMIDNGLIVGVIDRINLLEKMILSTFEENES